MEKSEKNYLNNFLKQNKLYNVNYTNIVDRISIKKIKSHTSISLTLLLCIDKYSIWEVTINSDSIFTIKTINSILRDYNLPTIKWLWQNIVKSLILQIFKNKKTIHIKNISKKALTFWEKTINLMIKENIIKWYKFEDYPNFTFETITKTKNFEKKDYLWHIILFK